MASTLPSWNGPTNESQRSRLRDRQTENRHPVETISDKPKLEFFEIFAGLASPEVTISIAYEGKNIMLKGNRRTVMNILRAASEAAFKMEPGR